MHVSAFTPHQCSFVHTHIHDDSYISIYLYTLRNICLVFLRLYVRCNHPNQAKFSYI